MLQNLHVKNLALIDEIEMEFQPGLNILTGETGAGKSILLGSVHLALGGKYSKDMIRKNADFGLVELLFVIENPKLEEALKKMDIFPENHQILLSRKLMENRSISRINGETVTKSVLRDVASLLIDIHGQHDHESLLHKKNHLTLLDAYANEKISKIKEEICNEFSRFKACEKKLLESTLDDSEKERELSLLKYEIQEIENADLKLNEDENLEERYKQLMNGRKISDCVNETYQYTGTSNGASESLSRGVRAISMITDLDKKAEGLYEQLVEIDSLLNDFNRDLAEYEESFEFSESEFNEIEERLNQINYLKTKYGNQIQDIFDYYDKQCMRLSEINDYDSFILSLQEKLQDSKDKLSMLCEKLSILRKQSANSFEKKITQALKDLNFLEVKFEIHFKKLDHFTSLGTDEIEFYISTNPGEPLSPLANVASGGELSRMMLAIKTVMADLEETPTLIFDEIDTGISGITAGKVANQMSTIANTHQVLCITHLPQIAAMADAHFYIEKQSENKRTQTNITNLNDELSVLELARMIGGNHITDAVLQSAKEMKKNK